MVIYGSVGTMVVPIGRSRGLIRAIRTRYSLELLYIVAICDVVPEAGKYSTSFPKPFDELFSQEWA